MSAMMALFYLRLRKVGAELSHETAASDYDDAFSEKLFKLQQVVHVQRMALQIRKGHQYKGITYYTSKKGSLRIGS